MALVEKAFAGESIDFGRNIFPTKAKAYKKVTKNIK